MTRYFVEIAYNGTRLSGWQRQLNAPSVQAKIEDAYRVILREPTFEILGCGRTDAGVHATKYIAHFDFEGVFPQSFLQRANKVVGNDIYLKKLYEVPQTAHARFDAVSRSYEYHLSYDKNPFAQETEWCFPKISPLDTSLMQKTAELLRGYQMFAPFCKTDSDAHTMKCTLTKAEWIFSEDGAVFHITANRFLRGMVRLIVGACINVGLGKMSLQDVKTAMDNQTLLVKSYAVPSTGLFLTDVVYPYELRRASAANW